MKVVQELVYVYPTQVSPDPHSTKATRKGGSPIQVHKTIIKNLGQLNRPIFISQLAEELGISAGDLLPAVKVLQSLKLIELDDSNEVVRLTSNGRFANLDYLC